MARFPQKMIYLDKQKTGLESELADLDSQRDYQLEEEVVDLGQAVVMFKKLLDEHVYPTKLFELLQKTTVKKVQFVDLSADLAENIVYLEGRTIDYKTLAQQMKVFLDHSRIVNLSTSDIMLDSYGDISFSMILEIDANYLKYHPDQVTEAKICE